MGINMVETFILLFALILSLIFLIFHKIKRKKRKEFSLMAVFGSGGHTREMLSLLSTLKEHYNPRYYIVANTDKMSISKIEQLKANTNLKTLQHKTYTIPRSREVKQSFSSSIYSTTKAILSCIPIMIKTWPDIIVCNGPGTCIPVCLIGLLQKILSFGNTQIVYVESICRVETLSLSARILYYLPVDILVQWPALQLKFKRTKYIGRLV